MSRLEDLKRLVHRQYAVRHPERNGSADWIYDNHVLKVVNFAKEMARDFLAKAGFNQSEIALTVDDVIRFHSCHSDERPASIEGRVLATADSLAHFKTDFYIYMTWRFAEEGRPLEDLKQWAAKKLERDYHNKIQFDEVRQQVEQEYLVLRQLFAPDVGDSKA